MNDKKINEKESLELITTMIENTKERLHLGDGNVFLLWGWLTVGITALVWILLAVFNHPAANWLFFLIWIIGGIVSPRITKKTGNRGVKTYVDNITSGIWTIVGLSGLVLMIFCACLSFWSGKNCWSAMFIYPLLVVGFAEAIQGVVVKEKSLIYGGVCGMGLGLLTISAIAGNIVLYANWELPMFIITFVVMMIIPGYVLNYKAKQICSKN